MKGIKLPPPKGFDNWENYARATYPEDNWVSCEEKVGWLIVLELHDYYTPKLLSMLFKMNDPEILSALRDQEEKETIEARIAPKEDDIQALDICLTHDMSILVDRGVATVRKIAKKPYIGYCFEKQVVVFSAEDMSISTDIVTASRLLKELLVSVTAGEAHRYEQAIQNL